MVWRKEITDLYPLGRLGFFQLPNMPKHHFTMKLHQYLSNRAIYVTPNFQVLMGLHLMVPPVVIGQGLTLMGP